MRFRLDVDYPLEKMEQSKKRMEAWNKFQYVKRVPVNFCIVPRYFTRVFDLEYNEIFKDAETQFYWLLQFAKYQIENIPCDFCTEPTIYVHPYFDNVTQSSAFGAEIRWPYNETPHAVPTMKNPEKIERLEIPAPDAGLWGKTIDWWHKMKEYAKDTEITFHGGVKGNVQVAPLNLQGLGPHMIAIDLAGENFYWWMLEYPELCHQLLDKITRGLIIAEENSRKIDTRARNGFSVAEDSSTVMSLKMFRDFVVPYDNILYDYFRVDDSSARGMHMCGPSMHLHKALVEDLRITHFIGFGFQVPPKVAAQNLGGKTRMSGNINPMLMLDGTKQEVKSAAREVLEALAPYGGLMLFDGANVCPGTPLENLAALSESADEYANDL